ncbi:MAG: FtsX-like permease family protein, partial [Mariprofundaceae bacterium]
LRASLGPEHEVLRWYEMYPMMKQWVDLENAFYYIFLGVVLIIVAAGVANTVLAGTLDRVHEFGVMMALGCGRARLAGMVLAESAILGLAGVATGAVLGLGLVAHFHTAGIDMGQWMSTVSRFYIDPVIRTEINADHLTDTLLAVLGASLLAGLWPALRAARLEPVEAIRHG